MDNIVQAQKVDISPSPSSEVVMSCILADNNSVAYFIIHQPLNEMTIFEEQQNSGMF